MNSGVLESLLIPSYEGRVDDTQHVTIRKQIMLFDHRQD
jgi:hypothetical protein